MGLTRRNALMLGTSAFAPILPTWAADPYPARAVKLVVPYTPGGSNDVLARVLSDRLGKIWSQPVIVENKPGAAGNLGADIAAKAPADGYTFLVAANNILTMNQWMFQKMPFDPSRDLVSVTMLGTVPFVLVAGPSLKVTSVKELIAVARTRQVSFSSSGTGSPLHLSAELFKALADVQLLHVPYKGSVPGMTDMLAGLVDIQFSSVSTLLPHIRSGKLTPLAVAGTRRVHTLPEVPTMIEAGVPGYDSEPWIGLSAPRNTPASILSKVDADIRAVLRSPDLVQRLDEQGIEARPMLPREMDRLVAAERAKWKKIIADANIKPE
ncbi:tripartite-type tricarboxylate transporter receptor subunit TctC [Variovorax boronicumulans]|uniref:Bug family tripartite tricarboxylate transporter substrate binding protein n=1 Tax=Variovorax boronicumulans TaxID=436515 RepID=UPI00278621FF|nr:tripartite tricarboxylate transporter substrate binding protein [Variovorax boronicumulans]MDP9995186.1 tripartite-type tricarboxylate transporter receptor subunit TctC [Variovorax boronicumulans]MDQ0006476.1 tripartite-type tricarboxylate transporter receptor subunit TctC [Variovorax boronicumulans]